MATRSNIVHLTDNGWETIYCHWDGYPAHNGSILLNHYSSSEKVAALVGLGDISSLHENLDDVVAYHRSHGERWEDVKPRTFAKDIRGIPDDILENEWCYAWDGEKWWVKASRSRHRHIDWMELTQDFIKKH
jgi:hypothetical protein